MLSFLSSFSHILRIWALFLVIRIILNLSITAFFHFSYSTFITKEKSKKTLHCKQTWHAAISSRNHRTHEQKKKKERKRKTFCKVYSTSDSFCSYAMQYKPVHALTHSQTYNSLLYISPSLLLYLETLWHHMD